MTPLVLACALRLAPAPAVEPPPAPEDRSPAPAAEPSESAPEPVEPAKSPGEATEPPTQRPAGEPPPDLPGVIDEPAAGPEPAPSRPPAPPPRALPPPEPEEGLPPGFDPMRDSPEAIRARGWLRSGIVATSTGLALGVLAIVLGTRDPCADKAGNSCFRDARDRAALTAGIPGAVLLGGGVAMLSVGAVRLERLSARSQGAAFLRRRLAASATTATGSTAPARSP